MVWLLRTIMLLSCEKKILVIHFLSLRKKFSQEISLCSQFLFIISEKLEKKVLLKLFFFQLHFNFFLSVLTLLLLHTFLTKRGTWIILHNLLTDNTVYVPCMFRLQNIFPSPSKNQWRNLKTLSWQNLFSTCS